MHAKAQANSDRQQVPTGAEVDLAAARLAERGGVLMIMNSMSQGGGDRVAVLLANGFAGKGIPTRIVLMRECGEPEIRALIDPAVSVVSGGKPLGLQLPGRSQPLGHRHLERFRGIRLVRSEIDAARPAVVLGASDNMALTTALVRRRQDQQILFAFKLTNRLSRPNIGPGRRVFRLNLFKFIFDRLDLVLTLSEGERSHVLGVHPGRGDLLKTVPNPYVTCEMLADAQQKFPQGPSRLLAAGRMVPQKRFDVLLRAFAHVQHRDSRLTILGDGPQRGELERLAKSLGIEDRVAMPGYVGDIVPWLKKSRLFVLSSDYEGLPAVVVEALATNVPVASTESFFAARELLGSSPSCAVVPIGNSEALAGAIDRCLNTDDCADLRRLAEPYRVDNAIDAHIIALADATDRQKRTDKPV
ncbi:MAG TPA: glycosyltransferase [Sphingomicrobium sp.]|nr:glycosyltransferase [Sphingomicrobium sp.]